MKKNIILPEQIAIDRTTVYSDVKYRIVEFLNSDMLLVVKEEDFVNKSFPLQTYVIPAK